MMEIYKPGVGAEKIYLISNLGNILGLPIPDSNRKSHRELRTILPKVHGPELDDYLSFSCQVNGIQYGDLVHRAVAKAHIPNPEGKPHINHIDGNKQNNRADNLEWCTAAENQLHAYATGLKVPNRDALRRGVQFQCKPTREVFSGEEFPSFKLAVDTFRKRKKQGLVKKFKFEVI